MFNLKSGEEVIVVGHLHEGVEAVLAEVLGQVSSDEGNFIRREVKMGRIVGLDNCVETTPADDVIVAQREGRVGLSRLVKGRKPEPTETVSVVLARHQEMPEKFALLTAFFGRFAPQEPTDPAFTDPTRATEETPARLAASQAFWQGHALVYGTEPLVPKTEMWHFWQGLYFFAGETKRLAPLVHEIWHDGDASIEETTASYAIDDPKFEGIELHLPKDGPYLWEDFALIYTDGSADPILSEGPNYSGQPEIYQIGLAAVMAFLYEL